VIGDIFQPTHLIFIFVVALLVLGPKRLPEVGRSLGKGIRDFRGAMAGIEDQAHGVFNAPEPEATSPQPPTPAELAAPGGAAQPTVSSVANESTSAAESTPAASTPAASPAVSVATAPSGAASGSGLAEPDPGDYAD